MDQTLSGKHIALLATTGFEDDELTKPLDAVKQAGADVTIISEELGEFKGKNDTVVMADMSIADADAGDYDGLLLPGGVENPDHMRMNETAVNFVREFFDAGKPVAAICHAPWLLIEAGVVSGRTVTSWPSLKTDLTNAGATWVDEEVVVDSSNGSSHLVTSRNPDDIPVFTAKAIKEFSDNEHEEHTA